MSEFDELVGQGERFVEEGELPELDMSVEAQLRRLTQENMRLNLMLGLLIPELVKAGVLPEGSYDRIESQAVGFLINHVHRPKRQN